MSLPVAEPRPTLAGLYEALKGLAERQLAALEANDPAGFLQASEEREAHFATLVAHEAQAASLAEGDRARIVALIPAVLALDTRIELALAALGQAQSAEMTSLHTGLNALHAYVQAGPGGAYFIDHSG